MQHLQYGELPRGRGWVQGVVRVTLVGVVARLEPQPMDQVPPNLGPPLLMPNHDRVPRHSHGHGSVPVRMNLAYPPQRREHRVAIGATVHPEEVCLRRVRLNVMRAEKPVANLTRVKVQSRVRFTCEVGQS